MAQADDPISERTPTSRRVVGQAMRAAHKSGEWSDVLDEVEAVHAPLVMDDAPSDAFDTMIATLSIPPPSSSKTPIGLFGPPTERAIRTLDPRQPSIETTRVDLFTSPEPSPPPVSARAPQPSEPRSYRTRVGLYYVPRDPATEPTLPELGGDDTGYTLRTAPLRREGPIARFAAWFRHKLAPRR